jgi:hypothetical protein
MKFNVTHLVEGEATREEFSATTVLLLPLNQLPQHWSTQAVSCRPGRAKAALEPICFSRRKI